MLSNSGHAAVFPLLAWDIAGLVGDHLESAENQREPKLSASHESSNFAQI